MFLRKLELQGFKSFADKISLDITHSITAIVGPNGSGKSNITDAIRWLLGEREARNLRGAKSEDLIFAGTKDRPRLGLAQATMHFDNSSGFFPVDFKEVSISRKISRDGTSEFFLNKSEVRLIDIINFFAKSRLGARGLTIISQGQSDTFINATPNERREMVEEILGLKEYQLKKADAKRRLRNSNFNLEKAKALIDELLPRLRLLKRQTARYESRASIVAELNELEDNFYGSRLKSLMSVALMLEPKIKASELRISKTEISLNELEEELNKVKKSEPETKDDASLIQERNKELLSRYSNLQKELGKIEARLEYEVQNGGDKNADSIKILNEIKLIARGIIYEEDVTKLKEGINKILNLLEESLPEANSGDSGLLEAKEKLTNDLEAIQKELNNLSAKEAETIESLKGYNEKFKSAFLAFETRRNEIAGLKEERSGLIFEREKIKSRINDLSLQIDEAGRKIEEFENWDGTKNGEDDEMAKRMFRLRGELAAIGEIDHSILKEFKETDERHSFLTAQVDDLEKAIIDLKGLIKELDYKIHHEFSAAIKSINEEFTNFIRLMFGGGKAKLIVEQLEATNRLEENSETVGKNNGGNETLEDERQIEAGIQIEIDLPKKRVRGLDVLSGGERSLVSIAALFALISVSPPPFIVLDEVDAALDERNARRFGEILKNFVKKTQFIVITHNRATMEAADVLYGVTMSADGTSKIVSLKLSA